MAGRVLVVDDNAVFARGLVRELAAAGCEVNLLSHGARVRPALDEAEYDVAVVEVVLPGPSGLKLLELIRSHAPRVRVIMTAASATLETAVEAMKRGAADFRVKPVSPAALADLVLDLVRAEEPHVAPVAREILGKSAAMERVLTLAARVAASDAAVLLGGESGTGKELLARWIHGASARREHAFLAVNCGAFAEGVLDSELFGHVRGAFTGARTARRGLFEEADGGTLFLDEIGSTTLAFQSRLLRVLEQGELRPVGASTAGRVDVRVMAASNVDLRALVRSGRFREDLYYRLNVVAIELPPLREREADVELLARRFVAEVAVAAGRGEPALGAGILEALRRHDWPGNVRELRNAVERAVLLAGDAPLEPRHLGIELAAGDRVPGIPVYTEAKRQAMERFTREYVERLLAAHHGNVSSAARAAGIPRQTLHRLRRAIDGLVSRR